VRFETVHGNGFLTAADVDDKELGASAVDGVGAVVEGGERLDRSATAYVD
jgi:hypothetical protein